ncbi:MAG: DUF58 domain-containing protein [Anaerolineae bacterium]
MPVGTSNVSIRLKSPWLPLLFVGLVLVQATNPSRVWQYMLTGIFIANVVAAYWVRALRRDITMERRLVWSWAQVGDLLEERFTLTNGSWLPILWAEVVDHSTVPGYSAARVEATGGRSRRTWSVRAVCRRRGQFRLGPWDLRLGDPLGVFEVTYTFAQTQEVIVFPPIVRVSQLALPRGVATGASRSRVRSNDTTIDVASVREYRPGDVLSHIHWRTTARRQQLHVREFDLQPSGSLWIALDLDRRVQAGEGEESTAEYGVILAASLTYMVSRDNRPVGLFAHGATRVLVRPNVGLNHMWGLMHTYTEIEPGDGPPLAGLLEDWARISARDATLAIITPSCDQAWLEPLTRIVSRGISTSVTLLDRSSFGAVECGQTAMLGSLVDLGVQTRVVHADMQFEHVVPLAYRGVPRYRVGVTGRPIPVSQPAVVSP